MTEWLARPGRGVARQTVPPLRVSISRKLKETVGILDSALLQRGIVRL